MRCALARFLAALSAISCALTIALAIRSHVAWDRLDRQSIVDKGAAWHLRWIRINSSGGRFDIRLLHETSTSRPRLEFVRSNLKPFSLTRRPGTNELPSGGSWRRLGFYGEFTRLPGHSYLRVAFPYWLPATAFAVAAALPLLRAPRRLRRDRQRRGLCTTCGYDLRASPDRCPECGAAPRPSSITIPA